MTVAAPPPPPVLEVSSPPRPHAAAPPPVVRPLLRRVDGSGGRLRPTRGALALSIAGHALLAALLVLGIDQANRRDRDSRSSASGGDRVAYLEVAEWPAGSVSAPPSGAAVAARVAAAQATAERAISAAAADSAAGVAPEVRSFPRQVPNGLPPAAPGGGRAALPAAGGAPAAGTGVPGGDPNAIRGDVAGGRYGPGFGDRRLVVTPRPAQERIRTDHERYMDRISSILGQYNDSVAAEAEHQRRLHNWTFRDKNGREWGLGEGGVPVIAGRRIPVPLAPPIYRGRDREDAERTQNQQHTDIERQAADADRDRSFRERVRATRQHNDEERRRRRAASDSSAASTPTTPAP